MRKGIPMTNENLFPSIKKSIDSFIQDEDGSIPRGKLVSLGTFFLLMSTVIGAEAFDHSSHKSHSSHSSHSSGAGSHSSHESHSSHSSHSSSSHSSHSSSTSDITHSNHSSHYNVAPTATHYNHGSHYNVAPTATHYSHGSHTSHSNTTSHSNSQYSSRGDLMVTPAPDVSGVNGIGNMFELVNMLPDNMDIPQEPVFSVLAPNSGIKSSASVQSLMDIPAPELQIPNDTPSISTAAPVLQVFPESKDTSGNGA